MIFSFYFYLNIKLKNWQLNVPAKLERGLAENCSDSL